MKLKAQTKEKIQVHQIVMRFSGGGGGGGEGGTVQLKCVSFAYRNISTFQ